jgi:hypothetical protein
VKAQGCLEEETEITNPSSRIYANSSSPPFTQEIFEDVGNAVCMALLDLINVNPVSRIPLSCFRSIENVKDDIMNNLAKYSNGQINVCGVNHFSANNTKVGKNYASNNKYEELILKKEPIKKLSNSQTKEQSSSLTK